MLLQRVLYELFEWETEATGAKPPPSRDGLQRQIRLEGVNGLHLYVSWAWGSRPPDYFIDHSFDSFFTDRPVIEWDASQEPLWRPLIDRVRYGGQSSSTTGRWSQSPMRTGLRSNDHSGHTHLDLVGRRWEPIAAGLLDPDRRRDRQRTWGMRHLVLGGREARRVGSLEPDDTRKTSLLLLEGTWMAEVGTRLSRGMRWLLLACGPMNVAGAICFAPPFPHVRRAFGLPEPEPFYLWVLAAWILAFGVAYFVQGWTGQANRGVLALAAWGKAVFALLLIGLSITGEVDAFAGLAVSLDLILAAVFVAWLWQSRSAANGISPSDSLSPH